MAPKKVVNTAEALLETFMRVNAELSDSDYRSVDVDETTDAPDTHWLENPMEFIIDGLTLDALHTMHPRQWLEEGLRRPGVSELFVVERLVAAAMGWTGPEYSYAKEVFFTAYTNDIKADGTTHKTLNQWVKFCQSRLGKHYREAKALRLMNLWDLVGLLHPSYWQYIYADRHNQHTMSNDQTHATGQNAATAATPYGIAGEHLNSAPDGVAQNQPTTHGATVGTGHFQSPLPTLSVFNQSARAHGNAMPEAPYTGPRVLSRAEADEIKEISRTYGGYDIDAHRWPTPAVNRPAIGGTRLNLFGTLLPNVPTATHNHAAANNHQFATGTTKQKAARTTDDGNDSDSSVDLDDYEPEWLAEMDASKGYVRKPKWEKAALTPGFPPAKEAWRELVKRKLNKGQDE